jgi:transposase
MQVVKRTHEGLAAARKRGSTGGRPKALSEEARQEIIQMRDDEHRPIAEIARTFKVKRGGDADAGAGALIFFSEVQNQKKVGR